MSLDAFRLEGKNALVTGSRRGLGAAIAEALAKAGANVGAMDEIRNLARPVTTFVLPVARPFIFLVILRIPMCAQP
jgi:NAD(P)-dependent dehydrogenase (short-subunit alcohol dehydrogenase family)